MAADTASVKTRWFSTPCKCFLFSHRPACSGLRRSFCELQLAVAGFYLVPDGEPRLRWNVVRIAFSCGDSVFREAVVAAMLVSQEPLPMKGVVVVHDENIDPFQTARDPACEATMCASKFAFGHERTLTATFRRRSAAPMHRAAFDR
jgi:hypothetical protein